MKRFVLALVGSALTALLIFVPAGLAKPLPHYCPHPHNHWADLDVTSATAHIPHRPKPFLVEYRRGR